MCVLLQLGGEDSEPTHEDSPESEDMPAQSARPRWAKPADGNIILKQQDGRFIGIGEGRMLISTF